MKHFSATTTHRYVLGTSLRSRFDPDEVQRRLRRSDIVAVDLDECVYPGFSQTDLGYLIFFKIAVKPLVSSDRRFLPQMLSGGAYIRKVALLSRFGRMPTSRQLMQRYEQSMLGIPEDYFLEQARRIPSRSYSGALETLRLLGKRAPLGFISLGIDVIAGQYIRHLNHDGELQVRFADSNRIVFATDGSGRRVFKRYHSPLLIGAEDKLRLLKSRMAQAGASCPLVIGNSKDEAAMAKLARSCGGLSIGILPSRRDAGEFDLLVEYSSWQPLLTLLEPLLIDSPNRPDI